MNEGYPELFEHEQATEPSGPVECLGMTFESDEALAEFVERYGRPYDPAVPYHREPFAVDVSEGKTDPLYKAHGYHTKVPHLAIVPSILHYTKPGDIVLDGFCGSGMTGVAAQWCGTAPLQYRRQLEQRWEEDEREKPEWGARQVILGDLSPAATFIAAGYNLPFDVAAFTKAAKRLLKEVEEEIGWMYETVHTDGKTKGRINYTVWSEVFSCPECAGQVVFVEEALDEETKRIRDDFPCPTCGVLLSKPRLDRLYASLFDPSAGSSGKSSSGTSSPRCSRSQQRDRRRSLVVSRRRRPGIGRAGIHPDRPRAARQRRSPEPPASLDPSASGALAARMPPARPPALRAQQPAPEWRTPGSRPGRPPSRVDVSRP